MPVKYKCFCKDSRSDLCIAMILLTSFVNKDQSV